MQLNPVGIDLAKSVFQLSIADSRHAVIARKRVTRAQFHRWLATSEPRKLIMEACATSHYWGREPKGYGHQVVLLNAHYVRPYVRRDKTDAADADALVEASRNADLKPIPIKNEEQQALQSLHRIRTQWVSSRTARVNEARALLLEFGVILPRGTAKLQEELRLVNNRIPVLLQNAMHRLADEISDLSERERMLDNELSAYAKASPLCQRLMTIPGVGVIIATALVGRVQDLHRFKSGRSFSSWLGITARENSSGNTRHLGPISRRGDTYLRTLLTHGARSALLAARRQQRSGKPLTHIQTWALNLEARSCHNKATIALANKMARSIWAIWTSESIYNGNDALRFAA